jgi:citrate lyase synthetase
VETPRSTSATEVREKIKNEDFTSFKKLVPPSISSLYNSLVNGMNSHIKISESLED